MGRVRSSSVIVEPVTVIPFFSRTFLNTTIANRAGLLTVQNVLTVSEFCLIVPDTVIKFVPLSR